MEAKYLLKFMMEVQLCFAAASKKEAVIYNYNYKYNCRCVLIPIVKKNV